MTAHPICGCPALPGNHVHLPPLLKVDVVGFPSCFSKPIAGCFNCGHEIPWPHYGKTCPKCRVIHPKREEPQYAPRGKCGDQCYARPNDQGVYDCGGCP